MKHKCTFCEKQKQFIFGTPKAKICWDCIMNALEVLGKTAQGILIKERKGE